MIFEVSVCSKLFLDVLKQSSLASHICNELVISSFISLCVLNGLFALRRIKPKVMRFFNNIMTGRTRPS